MSKLKAIKTITRNVLSIKKVSNKAQTYTECLMVAIWFIKVFSYTCRLEAQTISSGDFIALFSLISIATMITLFTLTKINAIITRVVFNG